MNNAMKRCQFCAVNRRVIEELEKGYSACCNWFVDNVICGHEDSTDNCPDFEPLEAKK